MKNFKSTFFYIFIYLLGIAPVFAAPNPPSPGGKKAPTPPGLPIDNDVLLLITIAVLYGIYIIFKFRSKQKTPFL